MKRLLVVLALLAAVAGCTPTAAEPAGHSSPGSTGSSITAELAKVKVVAERPEVPGYDRSCKKGHGCVFGAAWKDVDRNGCDTRNDVLNAQLTGIVTKPGTRGCVVIKGTLQDPYTGREIVFVKARATAVQIDHVYPLGRAWDMGASTWTLERRVEFANEQERNLLAVDGRANAAKGDDGPGEWMPLNAGFRCEYVLRYLRVAVEYELPVTQGDVDAAREIAPKCGGAR